MRPEERVAAKHIFVTGGVASSLGKGLTASSLGRESPTRATSLELTPFDFETSRVTVDDSKVNGVHEHTSRWRDEIDTQPSHVRQVAA